MKPIPFLAALLVLVAMTMPWFTVNDTKRMGLPVTSSQAEKITLWDIMKEAYSNPQAVKENVIKTLQMKSPSSVDSILPLIGIPLVVLGAVIGLFKGKLGHGLGLLGMLLLTLSLVHSPVTGIRGSLTVGVGYVLSWVGFSIGFISALASK